MKLKLVKALAYVLILGAVVVATILLTKEGEEVQYFAPPTVEEVVTNRAEKWLQTPEALEYAKNKARTELVEELSKI